MNRIYLIIALLVMLAGLSAIDLSHHDGRNWKIDTFELQQSELLEFETVRDKDGMQLKENWEGISLLPWLDNLAGSNWQSVRVETNDGYILSFSRLELKANAAYLALELEGKQLTDYEIRIILPTYRENKWPRNLKSLSLEAFKPMLPPRQIFVWEHLMSPLTGQDTKLDHIIPLETLMRDFFVQEAAEVLFVDKQKQSLKLRYPEDLSESRIEVHRDNTIWLKTETLETSKQLDEIVYLQCGPIAYIRKPFLQDIKSLGDILGWDFKAKTLKVYTQKGKRFKGGAVKKGCWLGCE